MTLDVIQKKGDARNLDGRLTVYALVMLEQTELSAMKHPIASMVHNGLLVAQGNYREQNNLRDFLKAEMGVTLEEGLEDIIDKLDGLESALDPQKLRDKIEEMGELEDLIPTPAKIVTFYSEADVLSQDGDIFFTGVYKGLGNANLSVNAFPILYQARFREQQLELVRSEIDRLISQIEKNAPLPGQKEDGSGNAVEEKILKDFIPAMLYSRLDAKAFMAARDQFSAFTGEFKCPLETAAIIKTISAGNELAGSQYKLLELYARKIGLMASNNFSEADRLAESIRKLESESGPAHSE